MLPVLTVIGDAFALFGGYIISVTAANQSGSVYWGQIKQIMDFETIFSGIVKPFIFGYLISTISCYMGLATRGGARGLRKSTTEAVVYSTIMIIIGDFMVTKILIITLGIPI
jgi:phospholipid/cholesterol/gamma-HCH transport system permease protein